MIGTDWIAVKADYMGGASYGVLAARYHLSKSTIHKRSKREDWDRQREQLVNDVETKTIERASDAIADNAVKLHRARGLALDRLIAALEQMPQTGGSHVRQMQPDAHGLPVSVDYDLLAIVSALEKLGANLDSERVDDPVLDLLRRLDDAAAE